MFETSRIQKWACTQSWSRIALKAGSTLMHHSYNCSSKEQLPSHSESCISTWKLDLTNTPVLFIFGLIPTRRDISKVTRHLFYSAGVLPHIVATASIG